MAKPIREPPRDLAAIEGLERYLALRSFTADTAWALGTQLRNRLRALTAFPVVINISLANSNQLLFHACSHPGTTPDNDVWVSRKKKTVLRWGVSTWYMHNKFQGNEAKFAEKYALDAKAGEYAIHGGGVPVRVKGVEGVVAVIVVSGLKQDQDHGVIMETLEEFLEQQGRDEPPGVRSE